VHPGKVVEFSLDEGHDPGLPAHETEPGLEIVAEAEHQVGGLIWHVLQADREPQVGQVPVKLNDTVSGRPAYGGAGSRVTKPEPVAVELVFAIDGSAVLYGNIVAAASGVVACLLVA
jgi:hypothetical protein